MDLFLDNGTEPQATYYFFLLQTFGVLILVSLTELATIRAYATFKKLREVCVPTRERQPNSRVGNHGNWQALLRYGTSKVSRRCRRRRHRS